MLHRRVRVRRDRGVCAVWRRANPNPDPNPDPLALTLTLALTLNLTLALAPQVLGDYGAGPNHVLPTAGTGKYTGGLSVHTFLRQRTWMRIDDVKVRGREGGGGG